MKPLTPILFSTLIAIPFTSCESKKETTVTPELTKPQKAKIIEQGNKASAALFGELVPKLQTAMKSGGPEKAITVCKEVAQTTTLHTSKNFPDLTITRISDRARNPINQADSADKSVLNDWETLIKKGQPLPEATVKVSDHQSAIYYKPIMVGEVCLKCHGDPSTFTDGLSQQLKSLYPEDQATGYKLGELRGAFRVELPIHESNGSE